MAAKVLRAEHFGEPLHGKLFGVIEKLIRSGKPATVFTIKPFIEDDEIAEGKTVSWYLARLAGAATTILNIPDFARIVCDLAARRRVVAAAQAIIDDAIRAEPDRGVEAVVANGLQTLQSAAADAIALETRRAIGPAAAAVLADARAIRDGQKTAAGVPTGLTDLDRLTGGYQPGTLWIMAARPGMGKTALMVSQANAIGMASVQRERREQEGWGVLEFSLEVPEEQLVARHLTDLAYDPRAQIKFGAIPRGELDDEQEWRLGEAQRRFDVAPIILDTASRLSVGEIAARVRLEKMRFQRQGVRLAVVFIDYLKFIKASDRYRGNRVYEVGEISGALKQLSKDEGICVVLLAQLNRALEGREDKRPGLADLRESGDLEADADVVAFLHREAYYIEKSPEFRQNNTDALARHSAVVRSAELIIGKNRMGPTRTVELYCDIGSSHLSNARKEWA